ncbi:hypothetical protein MB09_08255 [Aequorivita vladivostokensis]|jgi:hypothetical protein|uniref:Uncharacterized protein n=1 Tax=Aequorivita vladivostokensis TaxID=171194 RepID=A0ABR5DIR3_9FLAO|nr:hypothetical protein MB09_08255 [Aequorivita vladivostokensis]|tara:strand:- start:917 stop:1114 length:198 start_codon:yes stop_codon:yes gene_type:complete
MLKRRGTIKISVEYFKADLFILLNFNLPLRTKKETLTKNTTRRMLLILVLSGRKKLNKNPEIRIM